MPGAVLANRPRSRLCLLLAWGTAAAGASANSAPAADGAQAAPGVFVHIGALEDWGPANGGDVANTGFVVGSRCVAVIDTGGTPAVGQALRAAIEQVTPLPVCYVINTHAHPDHMLGNVAFTSASASLDPGPDPAAPRFIASARFSRTLAAREPYYRNALQRDFGIALGPTAIVYPTLAVDSALDIDLGDRVLTLQAWPTAHTDNDLSVYDHRTRTLFTSDLLFVQHLPVLDGSLRGWVSAMAVLQRLAVATVVPGHGPISRDWPAVMDVQGDYLNGLLRDTRSAIRNRLTIAQAIARIGVAPALTRPATNWLLTDRFHRRNVTAAYAELEWEEDEPAPATEPPRP
ncbi:MAG: quinoprotein relay system zinc metallohydrolase 2 [Rhizobacter sp.]|nr:quinoprotein relay system zinc metallohydrolase 2 [Rhizobacter sp.]